MPGKMMFGGSSSKDRAAASAAQSAAELAKIKKHLKKIRQQNQALQNQVNQGAPMMGGEVPVMPNPTGAMGGFEDPLSKTGLRDAWYPGAKEAKQIYNLGAQQLDPSGYLDTSLQNLIAMQDPTVNPYLDAMLAKGQESITDQFMSGVGASGRGMGGIGPGGQINDVGVNYMGELGDWTNEFLGNQYQADMNRAMTAIQGGVTAAPGVLSLQQSQPYANLQNYTDIVSRLTGSAPSGAVGSSDGGVSGWDRLMGLGSLGIGAKVAGIF